jgi:hypothetical protein
MVWKKRCRTAAKRSARKEPIGSSKMRVNQTRRYNRTGGKVERKRRMEKERHEGDNEKRAGVEISKHLNEARRKRKDMKPDLCK